jgi:hypothetical protein
MKHLRVSEDVTKKYYGKRQKPCKEGQEEAFKKEEIILTKTTHKG